MGTSAQEEVCVYMGMLCLRTLWDQYNGHFVSCMPGGEMRVLPYDESPGSIVASGMDDNTVVVIGSETSEMLFLLCGIMSHTAKKKL